MLFVEQIVSGHEHPHDHDHVALPLDHTNVHTDALTENGGARSPRTSMDSLDREVAELEGGLPLNSSRVLGSGIIDGIDAGTSAARAARAKAYPLTLGLVFHSLADGLALGASALPRPSGEGKQAEAATQLSIVVFMALIVHKGKTTS